MTFVSCTVCCCVPCTKRRCTYSFGNKALGIQLHTFIIWGVRYPLGSKKGWRLRTVSRFIIAAYLFRFWFILLGFVRMCIYIHTYIQTISYICTDIHTLCPTIQHKYLHLHCVFAMFFGRLIRRIIVHMDGLIHLGRTSLCRDECVGDSL